MTDAAIRSALQKLKEVCGVAGELGDKIFISVLQRALHEGPTSITQLAAQIDAGCERVCRQILAEIEARRRKAKRRRR